MIRSLLGFLLISTLVVVPTLSLECYRCVGCDTFNVADSEKETCEFDVGGSGDSPIQDDHQLGENDIFTFNVRKPLSAYSDDLLRCYKTVYEVDGGEQSSRGCTQLPSVDANLDAHCATLNADKSKSYCGICSDDLCNPASRSTISTVAIVLSLLVAYVLS